MGWPTFRQSNKLEFNQTTETKQRLIVISECRPKCHKSPNRDTCVRKSLKSCSSFVVLIYIQLLSCIITCLLMLIHCDVQYYQTLCCFPTNLLLAHLTTPLESIQISTCKVPLGFLISTSNIYPLLFSHKLQHGHGLPGISTNLAHCYRVHCPCRSSNVGCFGSGPEFF